MASLSHVSVKPHPVFLAPIVGKYRNEMAQIRQLIKSLILYRKPIALICSFCSARQRQRPLTNHILFKSRVWKRVWGLAKGKDPSDLILRVWLLRVSHSSRRNQNMFTFILILQPAAYYFLNRICEQKTLRNHHAIIGF